MSYTAEDKTEKVDISIIIPTYNHCNDLLKPCLESIIKYVDLSKVEVIVVANGCVDNTKDYVESLGYPFKLIWIDEAVGYNKATNAGIKASNGEYIIFVNNDVVFLGPFIHLLQQLWDSLTNPGIVGPIEEQVFGDKKFTAFYLSMTSKKVINDIGYLDETFFSAGSDIDFCCRLLKHGYEVKGNESELDENGNKRYIVNFPIYHVGEATVGYEESYSEEITKSWEILAERYDKKEEYINIERIEQQSHYTGANLCLEDFKHKEINVPTPKYSIIIPTYNHLEDCLIPCIESIIKYTDLSNVEIIVVANGCTDNTAQVVSNYAKSYNVVLSWYEKPLGYTKAANEGIKQAKGDYIILLNNDCIILDQPFKNLWIQLLENPFISDSNTGMTGPSRVICPYTQSDFIIFYCVMIPRTIIDKVGLLDESFNPGFGEDVDYSMRVKNLGYKLTMVPDDGIIPFGTKVKAFFPIYHAAEKTVLSNINWESDFNISSWEFSVKKSVDLLKTKYPSVNTEKKVQYPLVGVIVPVYNAESTIKKTLDSIMNQTYQHIKVVVVNDCSTDGTLSIIGKYPITIINNITNEGVSASRNKALHFLEDCDYIAYCDADDWWETTHIFDNLNFLLDNKADLVYSYPNIVNEVGEAQFPTWKIPVQFDSEYLKKYNYIYISSVLHKKSNQRFTIGLESVEDWDYWMGLCNQSFVFKDSKSNTANYLVKYTGLAKNGNLLINKLMEKNNVIRLNLGCGDEYLTGYINCDLYSDKADMKFDAMSIPYPDNSVDEIRAYHLIEHFTFQGAFKVLKEWFRVLKPGGKLVMETPDLYHSCKTFVEGSYEDRLKLYGHFFAWPDLSPGQVHYFLYTEEQMMWTLSEMGYVNARREPGDSIYAQSNPHWPMVYLKVVAYKPM